MTYLHTCRVCDLTVEASTRRAPETCPRCLMDGTFRRNWKAEGVAIGPGVLVSRRSLTSGEDPALFR